MYIKAFIFPARFADARPRLPMLYRVEAAQRGRGGRARFSIFLPDRVSVGSTGSTLAGQIQLRQMASVALEHDLGAVLQGESVAAIHDRVMF